MYDECGAQKCVCVCVADCLQILLTQFHFIRSYKCNRVSSVARRRSRVRISAIQHPELHATTTSALFCCCFTFADAKFAALPNSLVLAAIWQNAVARVCAFLMLNNFRFYSCYTRLACVCVFVVS